MNIQLNGVSKRYMTRWIIKELNYNFESNQTYAITGINGSGKSTLMKIISGYLTATSGKINYQHNNNEINRDDIYKYLSIAAPYLELELDFTLQEQLDFYQKFKPMDKDFDRERTLSDTGLIDHLKKPIRQFSSGMQQRVQLILCLFTDVPCLLLDEPTSFLDTKGKDWFYRELDTLKSERLIIIASNDEEDVKQCGEILNLDIAGS